MACTPSGLGGGSGALATPSTMCASAKPSSCALCSATSSTRATTCVVPAGAARRRQDQRQVRGLQPAVAQHLGDDDGRWRPIDFEHEHTRCGAVAVAEFGEQRLLAGQRARRARAERQKTSCRPSLPCLPPGSSRRTGWPGRPAPAASCARRATSASPRPDAQRHLAEAAHADLADEQARGNAAAAHRCRRRRGTRRWRRYAPARAALRRRAAAA